jgi:co-chaperonin GroES (HSP10)
MAILPIKVEKLRALHDHVLVEEMNFQGRTLTSGIILPGDDGKSSGIRPRWGRVYAVGATHQDVHVGQWICVAHGRWTRGLTIEDPDGIKTIRRIDPQDILLVSDHEPDDDTMSTAVVVPERAK